MEWFLADCSTMLKENLPVFLSLLMAGLIGSASHCSMMCSPLVAAQMLEMKESKKTQWLMLLYHLGRISSYVVLAILAVIAGSWLFSGPLSAMSNLFMLLAGMVFLISAIKPQHTHKRCSKHSGKSLPGISSSHLIYFTRGMLMGFMPCGMVLAALMMIATLDSIGLAVIGMVCFGLATTPIMQLAGVGALSLHQYYPSFTRNAGRTVMACNGLFLCGLGLNLVSMN